VDESLRVVFLGTASFAVPALRAVAGSAHRLVGVVTRPDAPAGRGRRLRASPVKVAADQLGLPVVQPARVSDPQGVALLRDLALDALLVVAFGELLAQEVLAIPRTGPVNLHASLLPRYRGAAPIQRALLAGERQTGVTAQWMALELDAGDIILQRPLAIGGEEDFGSLHDRLAATAAEVALEVLALLSSGKAPRIPQPGEGVTYAPAIRPADLIIDWQKPAAALASAVRAFSPRPGARTIHAGRLLKLLAAKVDQEALARAGMPGQIVALERQGFAVATGKGVLWPLTVHPEGGRVMSGEEYARGHHLSVGERLGT